MKMKLKYIVRTGVAAFAAAISAVSCTDTWDEHYSVGGMVPGATLWENLQQDATLRPFVSVLDSCGYAPVLNSAEVFSIWAPQITEQEARQWIDTYRTEKANQVDDDDNRTIHQFIRNHIALFNHPISELTDDTVRMINRKLMALTPTSFGGVDIVGERVPSSNGVLYKLDHTVGFFPNIWERLRAEATGGPDGLDSVANYFLFWEREELDEEASVPGGIKDGQTVYLDSVMYNYNMWFNSFGRIDSEDSVYWLLAPTNEVWEAKIPEYRRFFEYHDDRAEDGDSLQDLYARQMLLSSAFFNVAHQPGNFNPENPDSICSTAYNSYYPGYYRFDHPFAAGGILNGLSPIECSNGRLYATPEWRAPVEKTAFMRGVRIEAEYSTNYSSVILGQGGKLDSIAIQTSVVSVPDNSPFEVSGGAYLEVFDTRSGWSNQPEVTFLLPGNLSNCPYDIKIVFASPLAEGSVNVNDTLLRQVDVWLGQYGSTSSSQPNQSQYYSLATAYDVHAYEKMDTLTLHWDGFPVCSYGEEDARVWLRIQQTFAGPPSSMGMNNYSNHLLIDCILMVPRPDLIKEDDH